MSVTTDLIAKLRERNPGVSDAAIAKLMKASPSAVVFWNRDERAMGPDSIQRACDLLSEDAEPWLLRGLLEAAKTPSLKKTLLKITQRISSAAALAALALMMMFTPNARATPIGADHAINFAQSTSCTLCAIKGVLRREPQRGRGPSTSCR
jgi:hypothetical protein